MEKKTTLKVPEAYLSLLEDIRLLTADQNKSWSGMMKKKRDMPWHKCPGVKIRGMISVKKTRNEPMDIKRIDEIVDKYDAEPSYLIQVLLDIQSENNWLPKEALERVAEKLQVPMTRVQHIATFYKAFSLVPKGKHKVHICMGTACHVRGATRVLDTAQEITGIKPGETDLDLKFSLETVNCLGCCALGPVMEIDGKTHGKMNPSETAEVLKNYE